MTKWILGAIAACGLCCIPLLIPAAAGLSVFGLQLFHGPLGIDRIACSLGVAVIVVVIVAWRLKMRSQRSGGSGCKSQACAASGQCGCK
ncbi:MULTISPECIES: hypothetical protein [Asticcacaulis]|uniref:hypothetical protein n=1 Tax=Asticcacaulis TaxID=76890 RepID=UPI001AE5026C|nr:MULTISPECIES: hypothetical protein [Asticcacaulis]MBP2159097.1 hypothetical protein [Asticcacaulis solisilvae]MDR6800142.1 hypothetical protein [Asticcacaulis sp. BE141]